MSIADPFDFLLGTLERSALRVISFRGRERLSKPYAFDVVVTGQDTAGPGFAGEAIGQPAILSIEGARGARTVRGVVTRAASAGKHSHDRAAFTLRVAPRLATLRHRRNSRIFQDRTAKEIVSAVLDEGGVAHRWETEQAQVPRSYCVQYEETDLDFVQRLLAETGAFYFFEHPQGADPASPAEVMVIGDRPRYAPIEGDPRLVYRAPQPGGALGPEEHHVTAFHASRALAPADYHRRDHDFLRPLNTLSASASVAKKAGEGEVYEHHGELAEAEAEQRLEGTALEQLRRKAERAGGESACPRLLPGRRFSLDEHELAGHDGDHAVTSVEHEGRTAEAGAGGSSTYHNSFSCVPANRVFRPARCVREPRQVLETAVVTGPAGQEIFTDAHGRIKVQFHWDREGKRDERSSCWIRVAQAWSGSGWGFQVVPRIGMEVLVSFLGGDLDRPMVVGCVPNATHPVPYPLPENQTRSGIKTQSTPGGGGFNELLFDDAKGGELVSIRAERNLSETVRNDHLQSIGHDQTVTIAGDREARVQGKDTLLIEGGQTWTVQGPSKVSVGGSAGATVSGARTTAVAGDDTTRIGGGHTVMAAEYSHLLIGHGAPEGHGLVYVNGNYRIGAAGGVQIGAAKGLTLTCGDSSIELLPGEIKLTSPKLTLVAKEEIFAKGKDHEIALTDHLELRGKDIRLFAKHGQLLLDDDAKLLGQHVKLGSDQAKPEKKDLSDGDEKGTITFRVKPHFELAPGDKLVAVIATPTGETVELEVDANMEAKLEGKKGDSFTLVDLRKGDLPFGKRGA